MFIDISFTLFISFAVLFFMRKVARAIGLIDKPSRRKLHEGNIPLVGGLSICITIVHYIYSHPSMINHANLYMFCICTLTFIGALDDRFDLSVKIRMLIQALISIAMIHFSNTQLYNLGDLFGLGDIELGFSGVLITIIAVIGCINAFNMVDGIDGLLGGLSIVTFSSLGSLLYLSGEHSLSFLCLLFVVCMVPYILMNLGLVGHRRKVFMGDAGSMMIGFTVVWLLIGASQMPGNTIIRPVTALWLIAVPLMDMTAIMIRRIQQGKSPFKPDRDHLHHIFQRLGCTSRQTLALICFIAAIFAVIGMFGEIFQISEYLMFYAFLLLFVIYLIALTKHKEISSFIRLRLNLLKLD